MCWHTDDHNLGNKFKPSVLNGKREAINILLERSPYNIKNWMDKNHLKMNDGNTKFMIVGSKHQLKKCETESINVNSIHITPLPCIKFLGAWTQQQLSFKKHPLNVTLQCSIYRDFKQYAICSMRKQHTLFGPGLVRSHLNYINSILLGLPDINIDKIQRFKMQQQSLYVIKKSTQVPLNPWPSSTGFQSDKGLTTKY